MPTDPSVITVTGADRQALLTDLTLRFGRVDIVEEREVELADGVPGWEVTAQHRPFTEDMPDADVFDAFNNSGAGREDRDESSAGVEAEAEAEYEALAVEAASRAEA